MATLLVGAVISIFVVLCIYWFCGTEIGCALRATGNNEYMVRALGANTNTSKVIGLVISNGMISVSGLWSDRARDTVILRWGPEPLSSVWHPS